MKMTRIGNQTSKTVSPLTLPFEYAMERGFDAFEWFPDKDASGAGWEEADLDPSTRDWIRSCGIERDIRFSVHVRSGSDPLRPDFVTAFQAGLKLCDDIGASPFIIHFPQEQDLREYLTAIEPLILQTEAKKRRLAIENVPFTSPEDINMFFAFLEHAKISARHVGLCLDLGHANLHDATRNNYVRYLHEIHPSVPVIHVHVHENYGDQDSHLPVFTGPAADDQTGVRIFAKWLKNRGFQGSIILEQWPDPPDLLDRGRDRLKEMFDT